MTGYTIAARDGAAKPRPPDRDQKTYDPDNLFRSNRNIRAQAEGPAIPVDAPTATT
ncbi:MAG: hypothetical protein ACRDTD_02810 [Pseudonocardiaceae bacterium]